jgi:hypothetical protein
VLTLAQDFYAVVFVALIQWHTDALASRNLTATARECKAVASLLNGEWAYFWAYLRST